jgi:hypothetical protein
VALHATRPSRVTSRLSRIFAGLACLTLITACGSSDYTYVTNESENTYFKVPASWNELDNGQLRVAFSNDNPDSMQQMSIDSHRWVRAFDASEAPSLGHLAQPVTAPIVLAITQPLAADEGSKLSLEDLRNLFDPVVGSDHEQAVEFYKQQNQAFKVEVLADTVLSPTADVHGIRILYNIKRGDRPLETRDLTVFVSNDQTKLYLFLVRCMAVCFLQNADQLAEVAESFTVVGRE